MKEVTLKIPDNKLSFFVELVKQLGFEITEEPGISEEHKAIVKERIQNTKPEDMVAWEDARKQFIFKHGYAMARVSTCPLELFPKIL